jgi:hypothetical protein
LRRSRGEACAMRDVRLALPNGLHEIKRHSKTFVTRATYEPALIRLIYQRAALASPDAHYPDDILSNTEDEMPLAKNPSTQDVDLRIHIT